MKFLSENQSKIYRVIGIGSEDHKDLEAMHSGLVSRIIRDLDSVLLYVVKVTGSSGWIGTVCNQSNMENGLSLHIVLPDSALDSFTTMTVHRS